MNTLNLFLPVVDNLVQVEPDLKKISFSFHDPVSSTNNSVQYSYERISVKFNKNSDSKSYLYRNKALFKNFEEEMKKIMSKISTGVKKIDASPFKLKKRSQKKTKKFFN
jgi:hypothetical protein